jgi:hypothetical protein
MVSGIAGIAGRLMRFPIAAVKPKIGRSRHVGKIGKNGFGFAAAVWLFFNGVES